MSASFVRESQTLFGLTITDNGMSAVNVSRTERRTQKQRRMRMSKYTITAEVDQQWFEMLGQLTRHQDGFVWIKVENEGEND
jgi:hypothetical protein